MIRPVDTVQPRDGVPEPVFNKTQRFQQRMSQHGSVLCMDRLFVPVRSGRGA